MSKRLRVCECCGKEFTYKSRATQKFCSKACTLSETKIINQKTIESHKAVVKEFREHLGFEASDTESTWHTEDIYKVKSLDTRYHKAMRRVARKYDVAKSNSSFFSAFKALFPKEWSDVKLWRLGGRNKEGLFVIEEKANYKVVYPALKAFWNAWSEHLGRTPTLDDVYSLDTRWLEYDVRKTFMPDFPFSGLFKNGPYCKGVFVHRDTRKIVKERKKGDNVTRLKGEHNLALYHFMKDLDRLFLRRGSDGRFKPSEFDDFALCMRLSNSGTGGMDSSFPFLWNEDASRRWVTDVAFPWLGIDATDFPHDSDKKTIQQCYDTSKDMLMDVPRYRSFLRNTFGDTEAGHAKIRGMGPILMTLWPDYDWDDLQFGAVLMGQQRVTSYLRRTFGMVHHEWRMPMRNGKIAHYRDTKMPMRMDSFIEDLGIVVETQGGHHYHGMNDQRGERNYVVDLERVQWCDAYKKRAVKRQGHRMVYIPIAREPMPVKGVHGKLPRWNWQLTTERNPREGKVGLAELFEMQGAKDAARKIRSMIV